MIQMDGRVVGRYGMAWQRRIAVITIALVALAATACGGSAAPTATPTPTTSQPVAQGTPTSTSPPAATPTASFNAQWQALIAKAKQEGEVDIVAGGSASRLFAPVVAAFQQQYGIKVNMSTGSSHTQAFRILAERQKGIYSVDIAMTGANTSASQYIPAHALDPVMNWLISPDVLDQSKWYGGHFWWGDVGQKYNFVYSGIVQNPPTEIEYNTSQVQPSELNSMSDIFNAQWKGKIGAIPPTFPGGQEGYYEMYVDPSVGPTWVQKFIQDTGAFFSTDYRVLENKLADGSILLCIECGSVRDDVTKMNTQGLPVAVLVKKFKEPGILSSAGSDSNIGVFNHPAHPAAAEVFLNWFLSQAGQTAMVELAASTPQSSLRTDVGPGKTDPAQRIEPGVQYASISTDPKLLTERAAALQQAQAWYNALPSGG